MRRREKERSRVRAMEMDNLRGLLGTKRVDKVRNAWMKVLCGVIKRVNEGIDKDV